MILNEFDKKYVSNKIKELTGANITLRKVHIDNVIPVTEENRKMVLDIVVGSFVNPGNLVSAEDIDGNMETFTTEEILENK